MATKKENLTQPTRARNKTMSVVEAVINDYMDAHDLRGLVHELLTDIVRHRPEDPASYCATYFQKGELMVVRQELKELEKRMAAQTLVSNELKHNLFFSDTTSDLFSTHELDSLDYLLRKRYTVTDDVRRDNIDITIMESFRKGGRADIPQTVKTEDGEVTKEPVFQYCVCLQFENFENWFTKHKTPGTIALVMEIRKAVEEVFTTHGKGRLVQLWQHQMMFLFDEAMHAFELVTLVQDLFLRHNAGHPDERIDISASITRGSTFEDKQCIMGLPLLMCDWIIGKVKAPSGLGKIVLSEGAFSEMNLGESGLAVSKQEVVHQSMVIPCTIVSRDETFAKANDYRKRQTMGLRSSGKFNDSYDMSTMAKDVHHMEKEVYILVMYFSSLGHDQSDKNVIGRLAMIEAMKKSALDISVRKDGNLICKGPCFIAFWFNNGEAAYNVAIAAVRAVKRLNESILDKSDALHCTASVNLGTSVILGDTCWGDTFHFTLLLAKEYGKSGQLLMSRNAREAIPSSQLVKFTSSKVEYGGKMRTIFGYIVPSVVARQHESDSD